MSTKKRPRPLNRQTASTGRPYPEKIVQFGGGNFLRAFADWVVDILNEQAGFAGSVVIVKPTPHGDYAALERQEGLFHVRLTSIRDGQPHVSSRLVSCVSRVVNPYTDYAAYLALARQPGIRFIISNTTEAGIVFNPQDKVDSRPPASFPAKLTQLLVTRYRHFDGDLAQGCAIIPCELIEHNGGRLREAVLAYADLWQLEPGFTTWLTAACAFCNTLVDRIVSGFPHEQATAIWQMLGYEDRLLVEGEQYHQWAIEAPAWVQAEFPAPATGLNIHFVPDVTPYHDLKVRILNGAHTAVALIGYLCNLETVRQVIEHEVIGRFLITLLWEEALPTLDFPQAEREAYAQAVLERFGNPYLQHHLLDIALNSVSKFRARLLPSLLAYQSRYGRLPEAIVLALAALVHFYRGERDGRPILLRDETAVITWLQQLWQSGAPWSEMAQAVLQAEAIWGQDLTAVPHLSQRLSHYLELIATLGMECALQNGYNK